MAQGTGSGITTGAREIGKKNTLTKKELKDSLTLSAAAIETILARATETGKLKGFSPLATAFAGYLICYESHHLGQIMLSLKQSGHPVDKKVQFGIWEWGSR